MSKIISVKRKEPDYVEEQTFFNNGQFTEEEIDLMYWALNSFTSVLRSTKDEESFLTNDERRELMRQSQNLIDKLYEGS